ncbi:uncharacterized protein UV8b_07830 [Ustilaginoidea virens]|uniref:Uncharacterized protein n=1 Tax=Ustilaginoidea virens TaxID=1159556 RepID=A0A063BWC0_USTVR|nr:uncharacterized protein UV8b_07830 [Ustilaginoidea virens]QUC23589.1 hypothetical protein UV8b_07830 [Ustilaginoidea virens]GAO17063.1 hypothetical protein UVI_02003370 [Ustilaginoidea virens]
MESRATAGPPAKKRRFFRDADEASADSGRPAVVAGVSEQPDSPAGNLRNDRRPALSATLGKCAENGKPKEPPAEEPSRDETCPAFDRNLFESLVGENVCHEVLSIIRDTCGDNLEAAVNMYYDGTYKKHQAEQRQQKQQPAGHPSHGKPPSCQPAADRQPAEPVSTKTRGSMPRKRYIGAFGVEGWATRSGTNLLKHGDVVKIERQRIQPPAPKLKAKLGVSSSTPTRPSPAASRRVDVIVRFTNSSGMEVGRLAKETASWVSTLMDQDVCHLEGTCVYAPERMRTNDTVFLQLRCFLLRSAFDSRRLDLAEDRSSSLLDQTETQEEKELRLRQVALVRLFQEINLEPTRASAAARDGRRGLLQAAEMDEQKQKDTKRAPAAAAGSESEPAPPTSSDAEEGEELEQDQLDALYKKAQCFDFNTPEAEPAESFAMTLRPYQKQSLHWMIAKEKDDRASRQPSMHPLWEEYEWPTKDADDQALPEVQGLARFYMNPYSGDLSLDLPVQEQHCLGGVLADEMGLGKTIQMLSLVHSHRPGVAREAARAPHGSSSASNVNPLTRLGSGPAAGGVSAAPRTTLVVAPLSLLAQWRSEAERASKQGTLKIELYYGGEKTGNLQALCSSSNASQAPDLVITSYGVVLSEFTTLAAAKNGGGGGGGGGGSDKSSRNGLFSLRFFRVILDEAHHIKNRAAKTARACYGISADCRWVVTGTPIVNKLEDLFSLVRFLGVEPWNNFSFWRTFITVPFETGDFVRALDVVQTVLEPLVMRRTKDMRTPDGRPLVTLPPKQIDIVEVELSKPERDVYEHIHSMAKRTLSRNVEAGTVMKAFTTIFAQILRLRQSCCHPVLVRNRDIVADEAEAGAAADAASGLADDMDLEALVARFTAAAAADDDDDKDKDKDKDNCTYGAHALEAIRSEAGRECPLCFDEPMSDQTVTGCWHSACRTCLLDFIKHETDRGVTPRCFSCREPLRPRDLFEVVRHHDDDGSTDGGGGGGISLQRLGPNHSSAKVAALLSQLRSLRAEHPRVKSVVFSQFTSFLTLLEPALARARVPYLRLDGALAQRARAAVLQAFADRAGFTVLLASLRAGGVGLNLTGAGRVFMMDPWWSFAIEAQAIDRVHRLGQEDRVVVKRFIVRASVEERMLRIQDRKKFIATSLGMMTDEEKKLQRIEDIKELLS